MKSENPVVIQCKSCEKPIIIECDKFHCTKCSVGMLHTTLSLRTKSEKLREIRRMGYELVIVSLSFMSVYHYFGGKVQFIVTIFYFLPKIVEIISERLSRIF